jgi:hypothetical protein
VSNENFAQTALNKTILIAQVITNKRSWMDLETHKHMSIYFWFRKIDERRLAEVPKLPAL